MNAFEYIHPQYWRDNMFYFHYIDNKETFDKYKTFFGYTGKEPERYPLAICPRMSSDSDFKFEFGSLNHLHPMTQELVKNNPEKAKEESLDWIHERIDHFNPIKKFIRKIKTKYRRNS